MNTLINLAILMLIVFFDIYLLRLVRKKHLKVELSIYFIVLSSIILLFIIPSNLSLIFFNYYHLSSKLMLLSILILFGLVFILLKISVIISSMKTAIKELIQTLSIMKFEHESKKESKEKSTNIEK